MDQEDDITEFEDGLDENTVFDPHPWGARQRLKPHRRFLEAMTSKFVPDSRRRMTARALPLPAPVMEVPREPLAPAISVFTPSVRVMTAPVAAFQADYFLPSLALPPSAVIVLPRMETFQKTLAKIAVPLCCAIAVLSLAIAYVAKPSSRTHVTHVTAPDANIVEAPRRANIVEAPRRVVITSVPERPSAGWSIAPPLTSRTEPASLPNNTTIEKRRTNGR